MTEKRVILAALLSAVFLTFYAQSMTKWSGQTNKSSSLPSSVASHTTLVASNNVDAYLNDEEDVTTIESSQIRLEIGQTTGDIRRVTLKSFASDGNSQLVVGGKQPLLRILPGGAAAQLKLVKRLTDRVELASEQGKQEKYNISYIVNNSNIWINIELTSIVDLSKSGVSVLSSWLKADKLSNRNNILETVVLLNNERTKMQYKRFMWPIRSARVVPRGTKILTLSERYFCQAIKFDQTPKNVTFLPSREESFLVESELAPSSSTGSSASYVVSAYIGPRDYFEMKNAGFESAFKIGIIRQIGLIMLVVLTWIAGLTNNYGVAIILFSAGVTCVMAPFTILSFKSMKKMQELKPQIDRITAKYKDDQQRANVEIFALYKTHRISPLSGCLPMLLQIPIFIALFQAISHFVALRGQRFLWVKDLSLPDRFIRLPVTLPVLGNDLNLLPIIMASAMFFQTKLSQKQMPSSAANPSAALMSGPLMSILFGVMFYQIPSGLVLYWLTNSVSTMAWYRLAK